MQYSAQKGGKLGALDASAEAARRSLELAQGAPQMAMQGHEIIRATVGQAPLRVGPDLFIRVELWGVGREELEVQPREATTELADPISLVDAGLVPEEEDGAAEMAQQVPEERAHLVVPDVLRVDLEVEADPLALGRDADPGDDREAIAAVAMADDRRLPTRRPGLAQGRDQEEARLVGEDDVGTQPRSVFFTRGQSFRFQRSMRTSSRSRARRSGFW